ncbi:MAG: hypothetical protein R3318_00805 [Gammaproteobacteria bacterium]|nr:hypothetical protein [Gammaproteobacteria bacterium]
MKSLLLPAAALALASLSQTVSADPKPCGQGNYENCQSSARVVEQRDGWYQQQFRSPRVYYVVDRVTQLCLMVHLELQASVNIDCQKLRKRQEWKEIITW